MSLDMARLIYNDIVEMKNWNLKQVHLIALGSNNLRRLKQSPQELLDMFEYLMRRARNIPSTYSNSGFEIYVTISTSFSMSVHLSLFSFSPFYMIERCRKP